MRYLSKVEKELVAHADTTRISADATWFRDCFKLASALILSEVQFEIREDGLYLMQMDEAHIARTDMFLPRALFRELKRGKEVNELRLDVVDINAIMSKIAKDDTVTFSIGEHGKLVVEITGRRINNYKLPLVAPEELDKREPRIVFATRVRTNIDGLEDAVDKAKALLAKRGSKREVWSGIFTLESNPMGVALKFASDDGLRSGGTQLSSGWDIIQFEGNTDQKVIVAQTYMEAIVKAIAKVTNMVTIEMSTFSPIRITAELPFKGSLAFWIAPRVPETEADKVKGRVKMEEVSIKQ